MLSLLLMFAKLFGKSMEEIGRLHTHLTFCPGITKGGIKSDVVPDETEAEIDVRVMPLTDIEEALAKVEQIVNLWHQGNQD